VDLLRIKTWSVSSPIHSKWLRRRLQSVRRTLRSPGPRGPVGWQSQCAPRIPGLSSKAPRGALQLLGYLAVRTVRRRHVVAARSWAAGPRGRGEL